MMHHRTHTAARARATTITIASSIEGLTTKLSTTAPSGPSNSIGQNHYGHPSEKQAQHQARQQRRRRVMKKGLFNSRDKLRYNIIHHKYNGAQEWLMWICTVVFVCFTGIVSTSWSKSSSSETDTFAHTNTNNSNNPPNKKVTPLPFNRQYTVPGSHPEVGDRSNRYVLFRKEYDKSTTADIERSLKVTKQLQSNYHYDSFPIPVVESLQNRNDENNNNHTGIYIYYDIHNCPNTPPSGYPYSWPILTVLQNWPTDDIKLKRRRTIHQSLCVFDYAKDYNKAIIYRDSEVPFIIRNDPQIAETVERWNTEGYVEEMIGRGMQHRTEYSKNNHFMYSAQVPKKREKIYRKPNKHKKNKNNNGKNNKNSNNKENGNSNIDRKGETLSNTRGGQKRRQQQEEEESKVSHIYQHTVTIPEDWEPPTKLVHMTYLEWLSHANRSTTTTTSTATAQVDEDDNDMDEISNDYRHEIVQPNEPHWYFRLIGCGYMGNHGECDKSTSEYLFDELPYFQPRDDKSLYIKESKAQAGIHCRFGMDGVIAENHFDIGRNSIVLLRGSRRYLLGHPSQCPNMALYPKGHPSARHSQVDWSDPDLEKYPEFRNVEVNEVVLLPGDAMYLPTHWFHYIVSLELNFQCNTRSGVGYEYADVIQKCGFST